MSGESSDPTGKDEDGTKKLTPRQEADLEEVLPYTAELKARGYPDWKIKDEAQKFYPGTSWGRTIDIALKTVTEEQVAGAKEEGIQNAMLYVIGMKASGMEDWQVEGAASRQRVPFAKEALSRVTPEQVAEEVRRRPKPTPEMVKEDQLVDELKAKMEYLLLPEDDRGLAEGILRMRWDGRSYVAIRYLLGESQDYEYCQKFNKAWVTTNFVKAEMLLAGRQPPRQTERGRRRSRKNWENSPEGQRHLEQLRCRRDMATMHLWKDEGKCAACGQQAENRNADGVDGAHRHRVLVCPMCGKEPGWFSGVFIQDYDNFDYTQTYCQAHRPHVMDKRREAIAAQAAYFRRKREDTKRRKQEEKEKRAGERRKAKRVEPTAMPPEGGDEEVEDEHYAPEEELERRLEGGGW